MKPSHFCTESIARRSQQTLEALKYVEKTADGSVNRRNLDKIAAQVCLFFYYFTICLLGT